MAEIDLPTHEAHSEARAAAIMSKLNSMTGDNMSDGTTGGAVGAGIGSGLLGGILGGALFSGGGLLGGGNRAAAVATEQQLADVNRLITSRFDAEAQREIQATIERTAAANLLAIATGNAALGVEITKGQGEVTTQVALTSGATQTQAALNAAALGVQVQKTSGDLGTQVALQGAALGVQVQKTSGDLATAVALQGAALGVQNAGLSSQFGLGLATSISNQDQRANELALAAAINAAAVSSALAENKYVLSTALKADGDQTRALINKLNDDTLNRLLTTAQNEIIELRGDRSGRDRAKETEVNVITSVNQNQAQQQQQQQAVLLNGLCSTVAGLVQANQNIHNSLINLGSMSGSSGTQANTQVR